MNVALAALSGLHLPLRAEPSHADGGRKIALVDASGRLLFKTPSNRPSDRVLADLVIAALNDKARDMLAQTVEIVKIDA